MNAIPVVSFAAEPEASVERPETDPASAEITDLVVRLSKADLRDPARVAKLLGVPMQRAGSDADAHRKTHASSGRSTHGWLRSARQELYLDADESSAGAKAELEIGLTPETCFRARSLSRRFYADDANPTLSTDGASSVALRIEGRKVLIDRRLGEDCVSFIRLFQNSPAQTPGAR